MNYTDIKKIASKELMEVIDTSINLRMKIFNDRPRQAKDITLKLMKHFTCKNPVIEAERKRIFG